MTYIATLSDEERELLMQALLTADPERREVPLQDLRYKLQYAPRLGVIPQKHKERTIYNWRALIENGGYYAFTPRDGMSLKVLAQRAHSWASWQGLSIATRQIDGQVHVWITEQRGS